jgi:hypothetical protein
MTDQTDSPLSEADKAWNKGYWAGYLLEEKNNPYDEPYLWENYEAGYEEGWLDS